MLLFTFRLGDISEDSDVYGNGDEVLIENAEVFEEFVFLQTKIIRIITGEVNYAYTDQLLFRTSVLKLPESRTLLIGLHANTISLMGGFHLA